MAEILDFRKQYTRIFSRDPLLSDIKPSDWAEKNIIIPGGKGRLNYDFNPYCRKIIDTMAPDHPARKVAVMKGSQITFSSGVIMPLLGYIIKEDPHNTLLMVGTSDLVKPAGEKLDLMIDGADLRDYIYDQSNRKRKTKSGDTDEFKHFSNGYIKLAALTNPKAIAQIDLERVLLDDFDMMKGTDKNTGNFLDLVEMRGAANMNTFKLMMIGTPLLKGSSNIEPAYLDGDQERYFVECPCCHEPIIFKWATKEGDIISKLTGETANGAGGIVYKYNNHNQLIKSSVGYVCYKCAGYFQDKNKQNMLREAVWTPTGIPISDDYYSFHISSLYAPVSMNNWAYYAGKHLEANPPNGQKNEWKMQVLTNTGFGETYEPPTEVPKATEIMKNVRSYEIGIIPEVQSIKDGNGEIVLLTIGADMNGTVKGFNKAPKDDARLDYEIVAHSASGATYSIKHGSIGTFIPLEGNDKADREYWSYEHNVYNSVWPEFNRVIRQPFHSDTGKTFFINMPAIDCGVYSDKVEAFLDWSIKENPDNPCVGVRGNKEEKYVQSNGNVSLFTIGKSRNDVYFVQVSLMKDILSSYMKAKWDGIGHQPPNFMNYPQPSNGLYGYENFFEHYQSEHRQRITDADGMVSYRWVKTGSGVQNHMWDCRVYNLAMREIIVAKLGKELGEKEFRWIDYVNYILS